MWIGEEGAFTGADGALIAAYRWGPERPIAIVQVAHGMGEHARRYREPLQPLIDAGIAIYANDHRGHGRTAEASGLGDLGQGGYDAVVDDMAHFTRLIRDENPSVPIVLLGHSMGSMLAQGYLLEHSDLIVGAALSGSAAVDYLAQGVSAPGALERLNAPFAFRTGFEWLSRDEQQVDLYMADPLCGFALRPESMASLLGQGARLADAELIKKIGAGFPIYIFAGSEDPVNGGGAWIQPLIERYRAAELDVTDQIYPDARHEVLNETNRAEVVRDFLDWIRGVLGVHTVRF